jgi:hypothetical protein
MPFTWHPLKYSNGSDSASSQRGNELEKRKRNRTKTSNAEGSASVSKKSINLLLDARIESLRCDGTEKSRLFMIADSISHLDSNAINNAELGEVCHATVPLISMIVAFHPSKLHQANASLK